MIRSSRITPLLSRVCTPSTLGIYAALVMTADGDLLGQYLEPFPSSSPMTTNTTPITTTATSNTTPATGITDPINTQIHNQPHPNLPPPPILLDLSHIGALIVEFAADYSKLARDMSLLDNSNMGMETTTTMSTVASTGSSSKSVHTHETVTSMSPMNPNFLSKPNSSRARTDIHSNDGLDTHSTVSVRSNLTLDPSSTRGLHCLIVELDSGGILGIAKAATSNLYVAALAESTVEYGLLKGRLNALAQHVGDAFSRVEFG